MHVKGHKGKTKNHAGKNNGPSRERYWRNRTLAKNKVRNLMKYNRMSYVEAHRLWTSARQGRMKG